MSDLWEEARRRAEQPFLTVVFLDEGTDGESIYVAIDPNLKGCVAQGDTPADARHNLKEVRVTHIHHLLEFGLDVPQSQVQV